MNETVLIVHLFQGIRRDDIQAAADFAGRSPRQHCGQALVRLSPHVYRAAARAPGWRLYRGMPLHVFAPQRRTCFVLFNVNRRRHGLSENAWVNVGVNLFFYITQVSGLTWHR